MPGVPGQLAPIPGAQYGLGTMSVADIYPAHMGIGGIRSSEWSIPAFAEAAVVARTRALNTAGAEQHVNLSTPAGWLAIGVVVLVAGSWLIRPGR